MMTILAILGIIINVIIILSCIVLIFEILFKVPFLFFRWILLRDFKIMLFIGLDKESKENKQLYVIAGVTWFDLPITYQKHYSSLSDDNGYSVNFTMGKKNWIKKGCKGFDDYNDAKKELNAVKKTYLGKKDNIIWVSSIMNEDKI